MKERHEDGFRTTNWTRVLSANGDSMEAKEALRHLCTLYYGPVEAYVIRYRSGRDDARDLTQQFFAKLLEGKSMKGLERSRGRFRSYLLGAVKHFLADEMDRRSAEKRGGGKSPEALPESTPHKNGFPPDAYFDRQWALTLVARAMDELRTELNDPDRFEALKPWLIPTGEVKANETASSLHMTEGAFKVAVHRLRKRFRKLVTDQIAAGLDDPESIQEELDYLVHALTSYDFEC